MSSGKLSELPWRLSDFVVLAEIHASTTGAILKARRRKDGAVFALKRRYSAELGSSHDVLHEARLLAGLQHRNVVRCFGFFRGATEREVFVVLEWAEFGDLYGLIKGYARAGKCMDKLCAVGFGLHIARALQHLHAKSVIHRDVKGLNVVLCEAEADHIADAVAIEWPRAGSAGRPSSRTGRPPPTAAAGDTEPLPRSVQVVARLADFGVSRPLSEHTVMAKTFFGTPLFLSPEMCLGRPYDTATDVWSLGVLLLEMLRGAPPFNAPSIHALTRLIVEKPHPSLQPGHGPGRHPPQLCRLVDAMLDKAGTRRPSASRAVAELEQVLVELSRSRDEAGEEVGDGGHGDGVSGRVPTDKRGSGSGNQDGRGIYDESTQRKISRDRSSRRSGGDSEQKQQERSKRSLAYESTGGVRRVTVRHRRATGAEGPQELDTDSKLGQHASTRLQQPPPPSGGPHGSQGNNNMHEGMVGQHVAMGDSGGPPVPDGRAPRRPSAREYRQEPSSPSRRRVVPREAPHRSGPKVVRVKRSMQVSKQGSDSRDGRHHSMHLPGSPSTRHWMSQRDRSKAHSDYVSPARYAPQDYENSPVRSSYISSSPGRGVRQRHQGSRVPSKTGKSARSDARDGPIQFDENSNRLSPGPDGPPVHVLLQGTSERDKPVAARASAMPAAPPPKPSAHRSGHQRHHRAIPGKREDRSADLHRGRPRGEGSSNAGLDSTRSVGAATGSQYLRGRVAAADTGAMALARQQSGPCPPYLPLPHSNSKPAAAMHSDAGREPHSREPEGRPRSKEPRVKEPRGDPGAGKASQAEAKIELDPRDRRRLCRMAEGLCLRAQACRHRISWPALWRMLMGAVHCCALQGEMYPGAGGGEEPVLPQGLMARLRGAVSACRLASDSVVRGPARSILQRSSPEVGHNEAESRDGSPSLTGLQSTGGSNDLLHRLPLPSLAAMSDLAAMGLGAETIRGNGVTIEPGALHGSAAGPSQREEEVLYALRADPLLRRVGLQLQQAVIGDARQDSAAGGKGKGAKQDNRGHSSRTPTQDRAGAGQVAAPGRDSQHRPMHHRAVHPRTNRADDRETEDATAGLHAPLPTARRRAAAGSSRPSASLVGDEGAGARVGHAARSAVETASGGMQRRVGNRDVGIGTGSGGHGSNRGISERARGVPSKSSLAEHARAMREQEEKKRARALGRPGTFVGLGLAGLETAAGRRAALDSGLGFKLNRMDRAGYARGSISARRMQSMLG